MTQTVTILGLGPAPRDHATIESIQALRECQEVHASGLSPADLRFLRGLCRGARVSVVPADAEPKAAARRIVAAARAGRRTALVTLLHPFHFGPLGPELAQACRKARVPFRSLAAVSALGAAIARAGVTLGIDCFGLQSFAADALARRGVEPNAIWPLAMYFTERPSAAGRAALAEALARTYPREHPVTWCSGARLGRTEELARALAASARAMAGDTLYFPPARQTRSTLGRPSSHRLVIKGAVAPERVDL